MDAPQFKHLLESYVDEMDRAHIQRTKIQYPVLFDQYNGHYEKFSTVNGKRFVKVIIECTGSKAVHCFVEIATGDIYKAATWSAPAKGKRGNLQDLKRPIFCGDFYR